VSAYEQVSKLSLIVSLEVEKLLGPPCLRTVNSYSQLAPANFSDTVKSKGEYKATDRNPNECHQE
jgi:hypothetical protein